MIFSFFMCECEEFNFVTDCEMKQKKNKKNNQLK